MSVSRALILAFICLRTNVLGRLPKGHLPEPRFEDSAALIGGRFFHPQKSTRDQFVALFGHFVAFL